jgi:hypothetical protein
MAIIGTRVGVAVRPPPMADHQVPEAETRAAQGSRLAATEAAAGCFAGGAMARPAHAQTTQGARLDGWPPPGGGGSGGDQGGVGAVR